MLHVGCTLNYSIAINLLNFFRSSFLFVFQLASVYFSLTTFRSLETFF